MSTIIDSITIFILCSILYPVDKLNALHIMCLLLLISLYLFEYAISKTKLRAVVCIFTVLLCLLVPEMVIFLPFYIYVYFYRKQYSLSFVFIIPFLVQLSDNIYYVNLMLCAFTAFSFYLAGKNYDRKQLKKTIHTLRDNSVEQQMRLKQANAQLLENQDNQIYIATLKERNRIAREIHDNVGHLLSRSLLQSAALLTICKDEIMRPQVETLKNTLDEAMTSIRNSVHDLHDESIDLKEAMTGLVEQFTFCPVSLQCDISRQAPKAVKYCLLTIVKEGLNNIVKHSNATMVHITVMEHPGFYQLMIEDNGTNSTIPQSTDTEISSGIGLGSMQERVRSLNGIIHIHNEKGFRIFVSIPK